MTKQLIFAFLCALNFGQLQAQNCTESQAQEYIENSDMKIMFRNGGDMFWNGTNPQYAVPYTYGQQTQTHAMFASAVWMGAYDVGGDLKVAGQTYRSRGNDYWAGPIDQTTGLAAYCSDFDKIWKVKRWAIEQHIADYNDNGIIDGPTDLSILKWPGMNNPEFLGQMGFSLPANQDLAPFYDVNGDGNYTPLQGDYPVFEDGNSAAIAEEILWSVFNDNGNIHTESSGWALKVEVQQTAYLFSCSNDPLLNKTLFVKHKIINRNPLLLKDYNYGIWSDFDLGCYQDDYVGTIPSKNTIYAYNSDNNDENSCGVNGVLGYGVNPPVQAVTLLNRPMRKAILAKGAGPLGDPVNAIHYYRLLDGKFPNGTPLTYGGHGYNPANPNAISADYVFPDNPNDPTGWSMVTANLNGSDQSILGSVYKDSLLPGESFIVDLAYSYHRDPDSSNLQNVNLMYQQIDQVQQYYDNNFVFTNCAAPTYCMANCVYPGDANNNGIANDFDILEMGLHYGESAATRTSIGDNWLPYAPPTPITNAYVDANGDNTVELLDFTANTANYKETHSLYTGSPEGSNVVGTDLFFNRYYHTGALAYITDTIVYVNRYAALDVYLGDIGQPISDLHGVTFRVSYDDAALYLDNGSNSNIQGLGASGFTNGWLDDDGALVYIREIHETGKLNYVGTRRSQTNYTGGGKIGRLIFKVKATAPVNAATMSTQVCFEDFKAIRADGSVIPIGAQCATIQYQDTNFVPNSIIEIKSQAPAIDIYPNPVTQQLNIDLGTEQAETIQLFNVLGECVHTSRKKTGIVKIAKNNLAQGIYTVVIAFENGTQSSHKVIFN